MKNLRFSIIICLTLVSGIVSAQTKNSSEGLVSGSQAQVVKANPANAHDPAIASATLVRTFSQIMNGEFVVNITITKSNFTGFAKLIELLPAGYSITIAQPSSASFNYDPTEKKAKFVWVNIPEDPEIKLSYTVHMDNPSDIQTIRGAFSFVEKDQTKKFILEPTGPVKNDNIASISKDSPDNATKPVAVAVASIKPDKDVVAPAKAEVVFANTPGSAKKVASVRFKENSSDFSYLENGETKKFKATPAEKSKTDIHVDSANAVASAKPVKAKATEDNKKTDAAKTDVVATQKLIAITTVKTQSVVSTTTPNKVSSKKTIVKDSSATIASKQPVKAVAPEKTTVVSPAKTGVAVAQKPIATTTVKTQSVVSSTTANKESSKKTVVKDSSTTIASKQTVKVTTTEKTAVASPAKTDVAATNSQNTNTKVENIASSTSIATEPVAVKEENSSERLVPLTDKNNGKGYYVVVGVYFSENFALLAQKNPIYSRYTVVKSQSGQRYYIAAPVENRDGLKQAMNDIRHDTDKNAWWVKIE
jgi:hypothetical protein